jgi:hypothetical protein
MSKNHMSKRRKTKLQEDKMEKNTQWIVVIFTVLALLVGMLSGAVLFPTEKEVIKSVEVVKEIPVDVPVEVEVIKNVEVEKNFEDYKNTAVELCLEEYLDDADLDRYQDAEIRDDSDNWNIMFDVEKDKDNITILVDEVKFRVYDTLNDTRTTTVKACQVVYYDDETKVKLLNII